MTIALITIAFISVLALGLLAYVSRQAKRRSNPGTKSGSGDPGLFWLGATAGSDHGHQHSSDCGHVDGSGGGHSDSGGCDGGGGGGGGSD